MLQISAVCVCVCMYETSHLGELKLLHTLLCEVFFSFPFFYISQIRKFFSVSFHLLFSSLFFSYLVFSIRVRCNKAQSHQKERSKKKKNCMKKHVITLCFTQNFLVKYDFSLLKYVLFSGTSFSFSSTSTLLFLVVQ